MKRSVLPEPVSVLDIGPSFSWSSIRRRAATPHLPTRTRCRLEALGRFASHSVPEHRVGEPVRLRPEHLCHTVEMARWMAAAIVAAMSLSGCGGGSGSETPAAAHANLIACQAYQTQMSARGTVTTVTTATSFDTIHAMERALA